MSKKRNISLMLPISTESVSAGFAHDLSMALAYHAAVYDDEINVLWRAGTILSEQRCELLKLADQSNADFAIFLDADMRFPKDVISRLVDHDLEVVAANCAKRRRPITSTAQVEREDDPGRLTRLEVSKHKRGLEIAHVVGSAVMCIRSDVWQKMPYPWFDQPFIANESAWIGEDVFFCGSLRAHDIKLWVDWDLSWEIGHIGEYIYRLDDVIAEGMINDAGGWDHLKEEEAA